MIISLNSLPDFLETIGIDDDDVSIGENADNRWCILQREDGKWSVFYRERGGNFDESVFDHESDACYTMLGRMTLLQITRGRFQFEDETEAGQ
ncbi:hypothetical protein [Kutzneria sp. NPDC052558]|uniref:hypothetical protein n=1 Tax=Kutzneria sp. NPDC052558 TaxID=3364121 RepID=UPI0037CB325C